MIVGTVVLGLLIGRFLVISIELSCEWYFQHGG